MNIATNGSATASAGANEKLSIQYSVCPARGCFPCASTWMVNPMNESGAAGLPGIPSCARYVSRFAFDMAGTRTRTCPSSSSPPKRKRPPIRFVPKLKRLPPSSIAMERCFSRNSRPFASRTSAQNFAADIWDETKS